MTMIQPWEKLREEHFELGRRRVVRRALRLPDGQVVDFDVKLEGPTVCAVALTPRETVLLVRQFRPGPEAVLLELPGGAVDPGETPEEAMRRELREETGYAGTLHALGPSFHCAYSTRIAYSFAAADCQCVGDPRPDATEHLEVVELSLEHFKAHVREGQLSDMGAAYRALDWLGVL